MKKVPYYVYCSAPWEEFVLHSDLSYAPCCFGPKVGKINSAEEVDTVWNGEIVRQIRRDLLNGVQNPMCVGCAKFRVIRNRTEIEVPDDWTPKYASEFSPAIKMMNILITEKCNLKCIMCNDTDVYPNRLTDGPSIPFPFIQRLGEKYFDDLTFLNPNCFGEFFVYEGFNQYLDLIEKHRPKRVEFITNGSLNISPDVWLRILKSHWCIGISLDAVTPETYHLIRVKSNWANVFKNIEIIKSLRRQHGLKTSLQFNFVMMKINLHELSTFVRTAIFDWGADSVSLSHVDGERNAGRFVLNGPEWRIRYNRELFKVNQLRARLKNASIITPGYACDAAGNIEGLSPAEQELARSVDFVSGISATDVKEKKLSTRELAEIFFARRAYVEAGDAFAQVYRHDSSDIEALYLQAECRYQQNQYTLARLLFQEVIERQPTHVAARNRLTELKNPPRQLAA